MAIKTFTTGEVLTAANTNTYLANAGLVYTGSATAIYGTTTQLNMSNVFSSSFTNYKVVVSKLRMSAASTSLSMQLLKAGTPNATAAYDFAYRGIGADGTGRDTYASSQTSLSDLGCFNATANNYRQQVSFEVLAPAVATVTTTFINIAAAGFAGFFFTRNGAGQHFVTDSFDGMRFFPSAGGTFEAEITIYGFRNA